MKLGSAKPVVFPNYRVVVRFMHGDADAFTEGNNDFQTKAQLTEFLNELSVFENVDQYEYDDEIEQLAAKMGVDYDELLDRYCEVIESDSTCDTFRAKVVGITVYGMIDDVWCEFEIVE